MQTTSNTAETDIQTQLYRLSECDDYEVTNEKLDVRGWNVFSTDGQNIGTVKDLIIDPEAQLVRYLLVEITNASTKKDAYVLIPIGLAEVDATWDRVLLRSIKAWFIPHLPVFRGEQIQRDYEWALRRTLIQKKENGRTDTDTFYDYPHFDDTRFLEQRQHPSRNRDEIDAPTAGLNTNPYLSRRRS